MIIAPRYTRCPCSTGSDKVFSDYYYQCLPGTGSGGGSPAPTSSASTPAPTGGSGGGGSGGGSGAAGGLNNKFQAKGKQYFGTEIDQYHLNNNALMTIAKNSFGQVTPENSMKWDATERE